MAKHKTFFSDNPVTVGEACNALRNRRAISIWVDGEKVDGVVTRVRVVDGGHEITVERPTHHREE
jgi:hypothetical protein